jgi:hypothetical protein
MRFGLALLFVVVFPFVSQAALTTQALSQRQIVKPGLVQLAGSSFFSHSSRGSFNSHFGSRSGFIVRSKPGEFRFHKPFRKPKSSFFGNDFSLRDRRCRQSRRNYYSNYCRSVRERDFLRRGGN